MKHIQTFEDFLNESIKPKFDDKKYYIVFDWYIQGEIRPTAIEKEFSYEEEAEAEIPYWEKIVSQRMRGNATHIEARNTLSSFIVQAGKYLNDANKYQLYL
jgi:hypothetical protein